MRIFADYHTHTIYSHGRGSVEDNVRAALERGLEAVAITDHGPYNLFRLGIRDVEVLREIEREVQRCSRKYPEIKIMVGVEANIVTLDGKLDVPRQVLDSLDLVLVGFHLLIRGQTLRDTWGLVGRNLLARYSRGVREDVREANTRAIIEAVRNYNVDIVTHPGLGISIDTAMLARACAERGTALEINVKHAGECVDFIRVAAGEGACFVISSDAHRPEDVGDFKGIERIVEEAGLPVERIINARLY